MIKSKLKNRNISQEDVFNLSELFKLMKPRVMSLVIFTCAVGLLMAPNVIPTKDAIIGIILVSIGAGAAGAAARGGRGAGGGLQLFRAAAGDGVAPRRVSATGARRGRECRPGRADAQLLGGLRPAVGEPRCGRVGPRHPANVCLVGLRMDGGGQNEPARDHSSRLRPAAESIARVARLLFLGCDASGAAQGADGLRALVGSDGSLRLPKGIPILQLISPRGYPWP